MSVGARIGCTEMEGMCVCVCLCVFQSPNCVNMQKTMAECHLSIPCSLEPTLCYTSPIFKLNTLSFFGLRQGK
jgi:hypothetical protein